MQVTNNNSFAINQSLTKSDRTLNEVASGTQNRLNDVASASIANQLNMQTAQFSQGIANGNDGIGMMQIIDGAATQLGDNLERLSELSLQYQNGTLNSGNRNALQNEFNTIVESMQSIIDTTSFNDKALFDSEMSFAVGENTVSTSIPALDLSTLDITDPSTMEAFSKELGALSSEVGATTNALESSTRNLFSAMSNSAASASQMSETDFAKAIMEMNQNNLQVQASTIAQVHKTAQLQQSIQGLLG